MISFSDPIIAHNLIKLQRKPFAMLKADDCYKVFEASIDNYHVTDSVDTPFHNPYPEGTLDSLLYAKNWIDTVQWHLEDLVRPPSIDPIEGMLLKRRIDKSNQDRTNIVEKIDDHFLAIFSDVKYLTDARINSESPAWLLDRMSILMLKIFHMRDQTLRSEATDAHRETCRLKLNVLIEQKNDMRLAFDEMMEDIAIGKRRFKVYRQLKMYNDPSLNPSLYQAKNTPRK